jgi:hypothetical protein
MLLAASCVACGISTPSNNTVEDVSGTVPVGGNDVHNYSLSKMGEVEVTITSLAPTPSASIGMALGQQFSGGCTLLQGYQAAVVVNRVVQFGSLQKGGYCLIVYDTGILTAPTAYTGKFSHP